MRVLLCDVCETRIDDDHVIEVTYPVVDEDPLFDDDDEPSMDEEYAHFCGYHCLSSWALNASLSLSPDS